MSETRIDINDDSDAEYYDLVFPGKGEKSYKDRLAEAKIEIKTKGIFGQKNDVDMFLSQYDDIAGKPSRNESGNLLHVLVEIVTHNQIEPENLKLLIQRLVEMHPDLLKYSNKDGYNPIHLAIRERNHQFVNYMVSACVESKSRGTEGPNAMECLDEALQQGRQDGKTSLHTAFIEPLNPDTTKMLIENASDNALAVQDNSGKTPMHYAVSFRECTDSRAEIIALFIKRDFSAMQRESKPERTFLDLYDKNGFSVYQEHETSKARSLERYEKAVKKWAAQAANQTGASLSTDSTPPKDPKEATRLEMGVKKALIAFNPEVESSTDKSYRHRDTFENIDSHEKLRREMETSPNISMKRTKPSLPGRRSVEVKSPARLSQKKSKGNDTNKGNIDMLKKNSKEVLMNLKLHYMRTRNSEMAISFLHGTNMDDVQISFDYDNLPAEVEWKEFTDRFGEDAKAGLKFDNVLQYVMFPHVEVQPTEGRLADLKRKGEIRAGRCQLEPLGRRDMTYFFEWLYKKGVRHIIRVSVKDSGDSGGRVHSDQAIQQCLERFVVEHLDWGKIDLDPETILHVSTKALEKATPTKENPENVELLPNRQLKELWLRWSGSNAVLRAWSEPEGLPMLPHLQTIYLFKPPSDKMFDNSQWIKQKVKEFEVRLNKNIKEVPARELGSGEKGTSGQATALGEIKVIPKVAAIDQDCKTISPHPAISTPVKGVNSHRWLESTSRFAEGMRPFWEDTLKDFMESKKDQVTPERLEEDIVVALIDDGVDKFNVMPSSQVLEGKSFDFHDGKVRPPFSSARGHGTVMASMILSVCPMAKIYPIRLKTYRTPEGKSQIDRKSAAQAIEAALAKKASIISMSWTLPLESAHEATKDRLHNVLQRAVNDKILMFCSSPDEGKFSQFDYPSGPWRDHFFRIGAARADGTVFEWTTEDGIAFVLPGVDVVKESVSSSFSETQLRGGVKSGIANLKYETGSSVSTALAAGLAAMIIYCVKASILIVKTANQNKGQLMGIAIADNAINMITKHDAMRQAFASLGTVTSNKFIQIWEKLDHVSDMLEKSQQRRLTPEQRRHLLEDFVNFGVGLVNSNRSDVSKSSRL